LLTRGLDALALPYLRKAAEIEPNSRDILTLKAIAEIGVGRREDAEASLAHVTGLVGATENDKQQLEQIRSGAELNDIRKSVLLRKIGVGDPDLNAHPLAEQAKAAVHMTKSLYDRDPSNMDLAFVLGYARYAAGQLAQAKPLLDALVVANPANDIAWTLLGLIARKSNDPDNEIAMYIKAIEADPHSVLALTNLASRTMDDDAHRARGYLATALVH
jgi:Flp pilus assembly protein TadD